MALAWAARRSHRPSLQVRLELRRDEAHLGEHLAGAARAKAQRLGELVLEHHDRLGAHGAVLGRAEREHVDPAPPGHIGRAALERRDRVGKARAVHVHPQAVFPGDPDQRVQLIQPVHRAALGRLGEVERRRLHAPAMPDAGALQRGAQGVGVQPAVLGGKRHDFGAAGIELAGPAFAVVHMADVGAVDRAIGRRDQGERQRIGRGPGRHRLDEARCLEQLGEDVLEARGDRIGAVGRRAPGIRGLDRGQDLGRDAGDVVAAQVDRRLERPRVHRTLQDSSPAATSRREVAGVKRERRPVPRDRPLDRRAPFRRPTNLVM